MRCPECSSTEQKQIGYETLCMKCGLVLEDSPAHNHDILTSRANTPELATAGTFQYNGRIVKTGWMLSTKQKNFIDAKRRIKLITSRIAGGELITQEATILYKKASDRELTRGRDGRTLCYACVYAACQMAGVPRTPLEIVGFTKISTKDLMRAYRVLVRGLRLQPPITRPIDLVHRFGSRLELSQQTITKALDILASARGSPQIAGKRPESIVAAALYLASKDATESRTQRQVANTTGVIEVTIRRTAKVLSNILEEKDSLE